MVRTLMHCSAFFIILVCAIDLSRCPAQTTPKVAEDTSFEVNTVRLARKGQVGSNLDFGVTKFSARNVTVRELVRFAYDLRSDDQIQGLPSWASDDRFDVVGVVSESEAMKLKSLPLQASQDRIRTDIRALIGERFRLHGDLKKRRLPVFLLQAGTSKVLMQEVPREQLPKDSDPSVVVDRIKAGVKYPSLHGGDGRVEAVAITMPQFAAWLSYQKEFADRFVIDATNLHGAYSFKFDYAQNTDAQQSSDSTLGSLELASAMTKATGLRLTSGEGDIDVLFVSSIERPQEN